MHSVACEVQAVAGFPEVALSRVVVEALYSGGGRSRAQKAKRQSIIVTAELAGELLGPLRCLGPVERCTWNEWAKVIGLTSNLGAKHATALCIQEAKRRVEWPDGWPRKLPIESKGALAEAVFMAIHSES